MNGEIFIIKEKNNNEKEILKLLQEKYELNSAQELASALSKMFKNMLQEMMNPAFDNSMGYSKEVPNNTCQ